MINIELNSAISHNDLQSYVENHPEGLMAHLPQWKEILNLSFKHEPLYLFAKNNDNKLCGILPLFHIKSPLTGNRLISLPFSLCGPIADSEDIVKELVSRAEELCDELKCSYLELRMATIKDLKLKLSDYFSTYVVKLSNPEAIWTKLHQKSVRWAIKKAQRDGVVVRESSTIEDLKHFYRLNKKTKKRLGVPGHPFNFFKYISTKMGAFTRLYLAEVEGLNIAGIITIGFKDTVHYAYAASDDRYRHCHANHLLVWQAIIDAYEGGYRYFDFGRTSPDDEGLVRFKKHWGTEQKKLYYYFYPKIPNLVSTNRKGARYKIITTAWKELPQFLSGPLSDMAFKHLD